MGTEWLGSNHVMVESKSGLVMRNRAMGSAECEVTKVGTGILNETRGHDNFTLIDAGKCRCSHNSRKVFQFIQLGSNAVNMGGRAS